jgi:hypothetical protein
MTLSVCAIASAQYHIRPSPHAQDGSILFEGILHDLARAATIARQLAIPNRDQNVAMIYHIPARLSVGILTQFCLAVRIAALVPDAPRPQQDRFTASAEQFGKLFS